ncbi:MAG TPA: hypothetical protein VIM31_00055 [Candidatus Microsaccharimonas sp.]|jgi:hypothetical protein
MNKILKNILILSVVACVGFVVGLLVNDFPNVEFDNKVGLSALISAFSLIAAIFIIPVIIQRKYSTLDNVNRITSAEAENIYKLLDDVYEKYKSTYLKNKVVANGDRMEIVFKFRQLNNLINPLAVQTDKKRHLSDFRLSVLTKYNEAYSKVTESVILGKKINEAAFLDGCTSCDAAMSALRTYIYKIYS